MPALNIWAPAHKRWVDLALRFILAAVFAYAGWIKLTDPLQFADAIASYEILPRALIVPLALGLPVFEILTSLLLLLGLQRQSAALGMTIVAAIFGIALFSALIRGLTIDCGCFGASTPSRFKMWLDLGRDILLFFGAAFAYWFSITAQASKVAEAKLA